MIVPQILLHTHGRGIGGEIKSAEPFPLSWLQHCFHIRKAFFVNGSYKSYFLIINQFSNRLFYVSHNLFGLNDDAKVRRRKKNHAIKIKGEIALFNE
jgi:hypothetical protein